MVWRATDPQGNEAQKVRFDIVPFFGNSNLDLGCGPDKVWPNFVGIDNGKDTELFNIQMKPDIVVGTCERLPLFASGAVDCIFSSHLLEHIEDHKSALAEWWRVVKPGGHLILYLPHADLYPRIGQPGATPDHKHDFLPEDIVAAMQEVAEKGGRFDLVVNETRDQAQEYSFLQVFRKLATAGEDGRAAPVLEGENLETWKAPKPEKTVGIVRPGAYGDSLWGAALARHFKRLGYHVPFYTGPVGREAVRADPAIDRIVTMPNGMLSDEEMVLYFLWESRKFTRWVNLIGVVEWQQQRQHSAADRRGRRHEGGVPALRRGRRDTHGGLRAALRAHPAARRPAEARLPGPGHVRSQFHGASALRGARADRPRRYARAASTERAGGRSVRPPTAGADVSAASSLDPAAPESQPAE